VETAGKILLLSAAALAPIGLVVLSLFVEPGRRL
jgi:hypothetical protein